MYPKTNLKKSPKTKLTDYELSIFNENIIDTPTDLAKLLFVLKNGINWEISNQRVNHKPEDGLNVNLKQLVIEKVSEYFDDSGEVATKQCFQMAVEYGFIVLETDPQTGLKRYRECLHSELDMTHHWFCFDCDVLISRKSRQFVKCSKCPRIFHRKCVEEYHKVDTYGCRYCLRVEESNQYIDYRKVDQKRVNRLIRYLLDFIKNEMKQKYEDCDKNFDDFVFVYKKINLSKMREKAEQEEYRTLEEFDDDFFHFMHNLFVTQINWSQVLSNFSLLRTYLGDEERELKKCVDCYERVNDKTLKQSNKEWFCLPCDPPHRPVFAKLKSHPYWPAKVLTTDEKTIEVCFFESEKVKEKKKGGTHTSPVFNKCHLKPSEIKEINDLEVINSIKGNQRLIKPLNLFIKYLELMPNNDSMIDSIETIRQLLKEKSILDESIESVVKGLNTPTKRSKSRTRVKVGHNSTSQQKKASNPISQKKGRKKKIESKTPLHKSYLLPPLSPVMTDSMDSLTDKVTNMNIPEEPPVIDLMVKEETTRPETPQNSNKRRSGRIAAQLTPQNTDSDNKSVKHSVDSVKKDKNKVQNKSLDESESVPMEVDYIGQCLQTNDSLVENLRISNESSVTLIPQTSQTVLNISEQNITEISNKSNENKNSSDNILNSNIIDLSLNSGKSELSLNSNMKSKEIFATNLRKSRAESDSTSSIATDESVVTTVSMTVVSDIITTNTSIAITETTTMITTPNTSPVISTSTPLTSTSNTLIATTSTSASIPSTSMSATNCTVNQNVTNIPKQTTANQMITTSYDDKAFSERYDNRLQELMSMNGPMIPKIELEEKLVTLDLWHKRHIESLRQQLKDTRNELRDAKTKQWCAVCHCLANKYCCVRFYCSTECQKIDWKNGHKFQCLSNNN